MFQGHRFPSTSGLPSAQAKRTPKSSQSSQQRVLTVRAGHVHRGSRCWGPVGDVWTPITAHLLHFSSPLMFRIKFTLACHWFFQVVAHLTLTLFSSKFLLKKKKKRFTTGGQMGQATVPDAALRPQLREFCWSRLLAQWGDPEFPSENLVTFLSSSDCLWLSCL